MKWQDLEKQILELLVNLIQTDGPAMVQQFLNDLVKIIEQYIPKAGLSGQGKISWADIRNALGNTAEQALLRAIAELILSYQKNC